MPWTPLHSALGETNPTISFDMIRRACEGAVEETEALDWKSALPLTTPRGAERDHQKAELAKDVAAMANSGGGMIVFGVEETRGVAVPAADSIKPVGAVDESVLQPIRQVAGALIYPPVVGLDLIPLAPDDDPTAGVLVLIVPDSPGAPHLVHPESPKTFEYFMAPYRHGPHTERMVEQQLASAYRQQEQRARARAADLEQVWADAIATTSDGQVWVIAVAVPELPHPRPRDFTIEDAAGIFSRIPRHRLPGAITALDPVQSGAFRRGLRRFNTSWYRHSSISQNRFGLPRGRVELHVDGTVVVATSRGGNFEGGPATGGGDEIAICDIEQAGVDLMSTLHQAAVLRGLRTDYNVRIGITKPTEVFRRLDPVMNVFQDFDESHRVRNYRPVDGTIVGTLDDRALIESAFDIIGDAVNQAGVGLYWEPESFNF